MAETDFLTEFARKPLQFRLGVFGVILLLVGVLYWQFLYKPTSESVDAAVRKHASLVKARKKLQKNEQELQTVAAKYAKLPEIKERNERMLPRVEDPIAFMAHIEEKATDALLSDYEVKVEKAQTVKEFRKTGFKIKVRGTYYQLLKFFSEVAPKMQTEGDRSEPLVSVEGLSLDKPQVRNGQVTMAAEFVAASFDLGEGDPAAKKKKGRK